MVAHTPVGDPGDPAETGQPGQTGEPVPTRWSFTTTDLDETEEFLRRVYAATPRPSRGRADARCDPTLSVSQLAVGDLSTADVTLPRKQVFDLTGTESVTIGEVVAGEIESVWNGSAVRYAVGEVYVGAWPGGDYTVRSRDFRSVTMTLPTAAVRAAAGLRPDDVATICFTALTPTSEVDRAHWRRTAALVRTVMGDEGSASSPLVVGGATRLLAETALAVFPHVVDRHGVRTVPGATPDAPATPATPATPRTLRIAEDFAVAHAHDDIGLIDMADAASVTPRALQLAFRRHHDLTPTQFLRGVRLAQAHADLVAGDPDAGDTVAAIAMRWGFANPGRFAGYYRAAYGRSPSLTLASAR